MPSRLAAPVLQVDAGKMHKVDPRNVESLFGMWMVFSKCSESIEEGKRLENLSWRLWNRETFCCEAQPHLATTPAINVRPRGPSPKRVPSLSSSVDSAASEDTERTQTARSTPFLRLSPHHAEEAGDSALSRSRGKEKHITSLGLEKMIITIKEKTDIEPLPPAIQASLPAVPDTMSDITPRASSPTPNVQTDSPPLRENLQNSSESCFSNVTSESTVSNGSSDRGSDGSDTSVSSGGLTKSASIIHGFSSFQPSSSFRSKSKLSQETAVTAQPQQPGKLEVQRKPGMFMLGGSSGDDESSFEDRVSRQPKQSSLSNSLKNKPADKSKKPSFKEIVQSRRIEEADTEDEDAIESDDDEASESAIEEDDAAWEDSEEESRPPSPVDKSMEFPRVESQANLTSRRSMLTMQLHNPQRAMAIATANAASRSSPALRRSRTSSPTGPSHPDSSDENENEPVLTMRGPQSSRPMPIIRTTSNTHPPAHSPRTTRRNMLATELTESLRKHLLWERKQKSTTANAFLKRRHTAQNMAHLQEYPDLKPDLAAVEASKNNSWNAYFEGPWEYHAKGW